MGLFDRWFGPREDEPEPVQEEIEPEPVSLVVDNDLNQINKWVGKGFICHFHMWPADRFEGKRVSLTVKKGNMEIGSGRYPTLRKCMEEISENFSKMGLTLEGEPDIVPSVAPKGRDLED